MTAAAIGARVAAALGARVGRVESGPSGQLGPTWRVHLQDGASLFAKTFERGSPGASVQEATGLAFLAEAATPPALVVPEVHHASPRIGTESGLLVLGWVCARPSTARADEAFGRGLAAVHGARCPRHGLLADNELAGIPQANGPTDATTTWAAFYRDHRLVPAFERAQARARFDGAVRRAFDRVLSRIDVLAATQEGPSRLHGDLWGGNRLPTADGGALVDPAAYAGNREVDLAMMRLFGGFSRRVFDAYEEALPLEVGARERVPLYQLYPLLAHVILFGESYVGAVAQALDELG